MNRQKGHHYDEDMSSSSSKVIVVAVKASKDISRTALVWALTHVVQPGDCIKLLVIIPANSSSIVITLFHEFNLSFIFFNSILFTISNASAFAAFVSFLFYHLILITLRKVKIKIRIKKLYTENEVQNIHRVRLKLIEI
jgi:hypothetical protein